MVKCAGTLLKGLINHKAGVQKRPTIVKIYLIVDGPRNWLRSVLC